MKKSHTSVKAIRWMHDQLPRLNTYAQIKVLYILSTQIDKTGQVILAIADFAWFTRLTPRSVSRTLHQLAALKIIHITEQGQGQPNIYQALKWVAAADVPLAEADHQSLASIPPALAQNFRDWRISL